MHSDSVVGDWAFSYDQLDRLSTATALANLPTTPQGYTGLNLFPGHDAFANRKHHGEFAYTRAPAGHVPGA